MVKAVRTFIEENLNAPLEKNINIVLGDDLPVRKLEKRQLPVEATIDGKRLIALCDTISTEVVVIDLDHQDPTSDEAIVWRWKPTEQLGFYNIKTRLMRQNCATARCWGNMFC